MAKTNAAQQQSAPPPPPSHQPGNQPQEQQGRTPQQQAEIERIGKADTYCLLDRDEELFSWFNDQRDLKICGYVVATPGTGLDKACQFYRMAHTNKRGTLFQIPATVIYINILQRGRATDLYRTLLEEFGHPLAELGRLRELRARSWETLKRYGVKLLIIGNADYLNLEALNELTDLFQQLKITIILTGTSYLQKIVRREQAAYARIYNFFLEWHEFPNLRKTETEKVIEDWENKFLSAMKPPLNLVQQDGLVESLHDKSNGLIDSLYELLKQIAMFRVDDPSFEHNPSNLSSYFSRRNSPLRSFK